MDAGDASNAIVRTTPCPRCRATVGLTADQLDDKRGTCAACTAGFDLERSMRLTDVEAAPRLERVLARRPGGAIVVRSLEPLAIQVRIPGSPMMMLVAAMVALGIGVPALIVATSGYLLAALPVLLAVAVVTGFGVRALPRTVELRASPGRLSRRALFARERALTVTAPLELSGGDALVATSADRTLALSPGIELAPVDRRWLADALREASLPTRDEDAP